MGRTRDFFKQHEDNIRPGKFFVDEGCIPPDKPSNSAARVVAYYLPQFHRIEENDRFWEPGFTEWTNVTKTVPRFAGHYQPRLPFDFGFYDLSHVDVLTRQAHLARRAGLTGFCFHYYRFGNKNIMDGPVRDFLRQTSIDLEFCINWANESWTRRWDGAENEILLQQYYSREDCPYFAEDLALFMNDKRYMRIEGRPLLMTYRPSAIKDAHFLDCLRHELSKRGLDPYMVMPLAFRGDFPGKYGFDAAAGFPPHFINSSLQSRRNEAFLFDPHFAGHVVSYSDLVERALALKPFQFTYFPGVCPSWDNEARRPRNGFSVIDSSPEIYGSWLHASCTSVVSHKKDERIVFINAWNEWAEGAYLEPDRHYGYAYLAETRRALDAVNAGEKYSNTSHPPRTSLSRWNVPTAKARALKRRIKEFF